MTPSEVVKLARYVKACCPQQAIDEFTPDAWGDLLGDLALDDCRAAVTVVAKRQPFVAPAEIRAEVARIRSDRIARAVIPAPPPELTDDPRAYQHALQKSTRLAASIPLPPSPERLAIARPAAVEIEEPRETSQPQPLRDAMASLRRKLGPARARTTALASPQEIARRQAAESRAARAAAETP